jgi:thiol:disulfide interchange protein
MRNDTLRITLVPAVPLRDLFPEPLEGFVAGRSSVSHEGALTVVSIPLTPAAPGAPSGTFRGVLILDDGRGGVSFETPIPASGALSGRLLDQTFETGTGGGPGGSLPLYLLFAVIGGLILNIMPCVLPVIALKVFGLVRMAGDHPSQVKKLGWIFSAGILSAFLALALVVILLQIAGQQVGWGFQFQEPLFVIAMSAIVFAFGLSLFGVYEIRVPGLAMAGIERMAPAGQSEGFAASFWEGVFATILATPCTAPFLGSALGFAFSQPWWTILLIFTAVAAGMALPYLVLTARPGWMKHLPKPGAWMETAKQFMGFLMMATLLWLLYVLGKQIGMEGVIWTGAFLLCIGISCWLVGRFATLTASRTTTRLTWVAALLIAAGGYAGFLEGVLDVRRVIAGTPPSAVAGEAGIQWESFTLASLEARLKEGKGVFLDFTADWCLTCKVNERTVLVDPDVAAKLRTANLVPIKADWTARNPEITRLLQKFGRSGVPLYVIFPPGRPTQPIVLPEVITPGIVNDAVDRAMARP